MNKYLILLLSAFVLFLALVLLPKSFFAQADELFLVEKGEGSKEIAANLEKDGIIFWGLPFRVYVLSLGVSGDLKAGTYRFSPSMNIFQIAGRMSAGDVAEETVTIIEGWNLKDIAWYFENKGMFQAEELFELNKGWQGNLEGYLFPDTYHVNVGEPLNNIIERITDNFEKKTAVFTEEIAAQQKTLAQVITVASLVEKEVKTKEDKALVAGILWKRLRAGVPLQIDATITYLTGQRTVKVSKEDLEIDSPYNTYKYYGLPPGPISNPGLDSIESAVYPKNSPYWYYLSTPDGETVFSKTLEEHNTAKVKYLK